MTSLLPTSLQLADSLLKVLARNPEGLTVREIDAAVMQDLGISSELASQIRSGNRTEFQYRMAWCRTKAKKATLIERTGPGTWKVTGKE
jgi:restriction endonuclease Mrr